MRVNELLGQVNEAVNNFCIIEGNCYHTNYTREKVLEYFGNKEVKQISYLDDDEMTIEVSEMEKAVYICQLSKVEKLKAFKEIKKTLIEADCFNYENIRNALDSKIKDLF